MQYSTTHSAQAQCLITQTQHKPREKERIQHVYIETSRFVLCSSRVCSCADAVSVSVHDLAARRDLMAASSWPSSSIVSRLNNNGRYQPQSKSGQNVQVLPQDFLVLLVLTSATWKRSCSCEHVTAVNHLHFYYSCDTINFLITSIAEQLL